MRFWGTDRKLMPHPCQSVVFLWHPWRAMRIRLNSVTSEQLQLIQMVSVQFTIIVHVHPSITYLAETEKCAIQFSKKNNVKGKRSAVNPSHVSIAFLGNYFGSFVWTGHNCWFTVETEKTHTCSNSNEIIISKSQPSTSPHPHKEMDSLIFMVYG